MPIASLSANVRDRVGAIFRLSGIKDRYIRMYAGKATYTFLLSNIRHVKRIDRALRVTLTDGRVQEFIWHRLYDERLISGDDAGAPTASLDSVAEVSFDTECLPFLPDVAPRSHFAATITDSDGQTHVIRNVTFQGAYADDLFYQTRKTLPGVGGGADDIWHTYIPVRHGPGVLCIPFAAIRRVDSDSEGSLKVSRRDGETLTTKIARYDDYGPGPSGFQGYSGFGYVAISVGDVATAEFAIAPDPPLSNDLEGSSLLGHPKLEHVSGSPDIIIHSPSDSDVMTALTLSCVDATGRGYVLHSAYVVAGAYDRYLSETGGEIPFTTGASTIQVNIFRLRTLELVRDSSGESVQCEITLRTGATHRARLSSKPAGVSLVGRLGDSLFVVPVAALRRVDVELKTDNIQSINTILNKDARRPTPPLALYLIFPTPVSDRLPTQADGQ